MQDLLRVMNDETWIIVKTNVSICPPKYNGKFIDITEELLDRTIKSVTPLDFNYLFILLA